MIEVVAAVGITAALVAFIVGVVANVSGFWARTSGRLSAESQARYALDQLTLDLQGALYRDDGSAWLAATIPANTGNSGLWDNTGTTGNAVKPANSAGSLQGISVGNLADARFGTAGTWLRFFTTKRGSNPLTGTAATTLATASAPVAVGYQIVRRRAGAAAVNTDRRYFLHRVEVTPPNTLTAGFDIMADTAYNPVSTTPAPAAGTAREIKSPAQGSVIAENVIDFGMRMYVRVPNAEGVPELRQIFPSSNTDLAHAATLPAGVPNAAEDFTDCFPEVVDVMVRVLTPDGARALAGYEATPQRVTAQAGRSPQQYWWDLALANSQVFTRRIVLKADGI